MLTLSLAARLTGGALRHTEDYIHLPHGNYTSPSVSHLPHGNYTSHSVSHLPHGNYTSPSVSHVTPTPW